MADLNINKSETFMVHEDAGQNLVVNGDFEFAPSFVAATTANGVWIDGSAAGSATNNIYRWGTNKSGTTAAQFDNSVSNSGSNSLKLSTTATSSFIEARSIIGTTNLASLITGAIPAYPSTAYKLTFFIKTNAVSGSATTGARVEIRQYNSSGTLLTTTNSTAFTTTQGTFTQVTVSFTSNASAAYFLVVPTVKGNDGAATLIMDAWFDDVILMPVARITGVDLLLEPIVTPGIQNISGPKIWG